MPTNVSSQFSAAFTKLVTDIDSKSGRAKQEDLDALGAAQAAMKDARNGVDVEEKDRPSLTQLAAAEVVAGAVTGDGEIDASEVAELADAVKRLDGFDGSSNAGNGIAAKLRKVAAQPTNVEVKKYDLSLDLRKAFTEDEFAGRAHIILDKPAGAEPITLEFNAERLALDPKSPIIAKTPAGDKQVKGEVKNGRLFIKADGATELTIPYSVKSISTDVGQYGLLKNTSDPQNPRLATILWPYQSGSLFPSVSDPADGASFKLDVKGPQGATVITNSTTHQVPSYDVALYVAKDLEKHEGGKSKDGVAVSFYTRPGTVTPELMKKNLEVARKSLDFYSSWLGPYAFGKELKGIEAVSEGFSMEHPGAIAYTPSMISDPDSAPAVIAHEIGHHWFGNNVRVKDWNFWMSEGFTTYLENRAMEEIEGTDKALGAWKNGKEFSQRSMRNVPHSLIPPDNTDVNTVFNRVPYDGGAWLLRSLEQRFGRPKFDELLKGFYNAFKNKPADTMDFVKFINTKTGEDILPLVNQFNSLTAVPRVNLKASIAGNVLTVDTANLTNFPTDWKLPVEVTGANGKSKTFEIDLKSRNHVELDAGFPIKSYSVDPGQKVFVDVNDQTPRA